MTAAQRPRIEIACSVTGDWRLAVMWPTKQARATDRYGPYCDFGTANEAATGIALRLTEEGELSPSIAVIDGVLWAG